MEAHWSAAYLLRKEMMEKLSVPTISQIKVFAGLPLALTIFEESHPDLREDLGLSPPLEGPRGDLWTSPSDLLIGKVALKPPLTQKHIQALTHQGILELGAEVEQKFINEMETEKENAIKEREDYLNRMFAAQKAELILQIRKEDELKYQEELAEITANFDNKVVQLLWEAYEQVRQLEEQMQTEYDSLNVLWQARLEEETEGTVSRLTEEFLEKIRLQEQILVKIFTKQIKMLKLKNKCIVDFERKKCENLISQMKHKLNCQNIANLMYLLCKERRKCRREKERLNKQHRTRVGKLKSSLREKSQTIENLTKIRDNKTRQLNVRETCLIEVLRQFQKFIYFALKAAPTQGEFLLNIDKLIKFELADFCIPTRSEELTEVWSEISNVPSEKIPQGEVEKYLEKKESEMVAEEEDDKKQSDVLPAFYFDDKMYVREDFRDMLSAGIKLDEKSSLWNPDVEELINIFKSNMEKKQAESVKSHSIHFIPKKSVDSGESSISAQIRTYSPETSPPATPPRKRSDERASPKVSEQCSVKKPSVPEADYDEREIRKISLAGSLQQKDSKAKAKFDKVVSCERNKELNGREDMMKRNSMTQSRLTLARDSLVIHMTTIERKSLHTIASKMAEESASKSSVEKHSEKSLEKLQLRSSSKSSVEKHSEKSLEKLQLRRSTSKVSVEKLSEKSSEKLRLAKEKAEEKFEREELEGEWEEEEGEEEESENRKSSAAERVLLSHSSLGTVGSQPTSKLLLAQDSLELIKSNMNVVLSPPRSSEKSERQKSQLTFDADVKIKAKSFDYIPPKSRKKKEKVKKATSRKTSSTDTPKTTSAAKVAGLQDIEERVEVFTEQRIHSLVNLMKENPSLIRLFTPCHK